MTVQDLPHVNALLNTVSALLILAGYVLVRRRHIAAHATCMLSATAVSTAFLACYLVYHYHHGHVTFAGHGWVRALYLCVLLSHTLLAALVPVMVVVALWRALRGRFQQHRRIARWTLPIWLYVSVTGVVVYVLLYHLYPARPLAAM